MLLLVERVDLLLELREPVFHVPIFCEPGFRFRPAAFPHCAYRHGEVLLFGPDAGMLVAAHPLVSIVGILQSLAFGLADRLPVILLGEGESRFESPVFCHNVVDFYFEIGRVGRAGCELPGWPARNVAETFRHLPVRVFNRIQFQTRFGCGHEIIPPADLALLTLCEVLAFLSGLNVFDERRVFECGHSSADEKQGDGRDDGRGFHPGWGFTFAAGYFGGFEPSDRGNVILLLILFRERLDVGSSIWFCESRSPRFERARLLPVRRLFD